MDVYVADNSFWNIYYYVVMVNGEKYDEFTSTVPLTLSDKVDVANYYAEALNG